MGGVSQHRRGLKRMQGALVVLLLVLSGCPNVALKDYIKRRATFEPFVYVSVEAGSDENPGTKELPLASIQAGIDSGVAIIEEGLAATIEVRVARGTYEVNYRQGQFITMKEGVSLCGGYALDFSSREPAASTTIIVERSTTGGTQTDANIVVKAENGITKATVLDGFTIQAGGGGNTAALVILASSPTIQNNILLAGTGSSQSYAIAIGDHSSPHILSNTITGGTASAWTGALVVGDFSEPVVEYNTISGGNGSSSARGIFNYLDAETIIEHNTITGGTGGSTCAIQNETGSRPTIRANTIYGGDATVSSDGILSTQSSCMIYENSIHGGNSAGSSHGISVRNSGNSAISTIIGNNIIFGGHGATTAVGVLEDQAVGNCPVIMCTIDGGIGPNAASIRVTGGSTPSIANDILFVSETTAALCLDETGNGKSIGVIRNNDLWDTSGNTDLYRTFEDTLHDTYSAINLLSGCSGNVSVDPALIDLDGPDGDITTMPDNDWRLTASSPVDVRQGGLDISLQSGGGWTTDKNGVARTNLTQGPNDNPSNGGEGWSMGPYEKD